ncbi:HPF/RaiA family ribosome-associated protein [Robertkochia aurantiaca]|uniref:HPF/RaiA family ribosome-associated protein n=1 Tax=Robertkochia aurantiaca TaxID=2873700 RepID=UPI001CCD7267|nr:HPF/RaiA family ribosome-associated protein [Robertkochia sp. 3YJGBD-33]
MTTQVQFVHATTNQNVKELLAKKLQKIVAKYDWVINSSVIFKEENDSKGKGKICEVELSVPGPRIFASANEDSFEKAADVTVRELQRQLKKRKASMMRH